MKELIKATTEPITKLIEVFSNGVGTLYKPRSIRNEADAKAYEIKVISKAQAEAESESRLMEAETLEKINNRLVATEQRRQNNLDDIFDIAAVNLKGEEAVSPHDVDIDWSTRFFNIVQDISDKEMKKIWGKILADEVVAPNSYSPRTLEVLRNLSKSEAQLFVKASECFMQRDFILTEKEFNISLRDILMLINAGLLNSGDYTKPFSNNPQYPYNRELLLSIETPKTINISAKVLTTAGLELLNIVEIIPNKDRDFLSKLAKSLKRKGATSVKKHEIIKWEGRNYHFKRDGEEIL